MELLLLPIQRSIRGVSMETSLLDSKHVTLLFNDRTGLDTVSTELGGNLHKELEVERNNEMYDIVV
jgi:hypothetical protein